MKRERDKTLLERFWSHVNKDGPVPKHCPELGSCWVWTAYVNNEGYGRLRAGLDSAKTLATHVAWFLETGKWPALCILHKCDNPSCVRFSHMFQGTRRDNSDDMMAKGRNNQPCGEAHPSHIVTAKQIRRIRAMWATGKYQQRELAKRFGFASKSSIAFIVNGEQWRSVKL